MLWDRGQAGSRPTRPTDILLGVQLSSRTIRVPDIAHDTPKYEQSKAWLEENGIDPARVLLDSVIEVTDDAITFTSVVRTATGALVIAPDGEHVIREAVTLPKVSPPEAYGL